MKISGDQSAHSSCQEVLSIPNASWDESVFLAEVPKIDDAALMSKNSNKVDVAFSARN